MTMENILEHLSQQIQNDTICVSTAGDTIKILKTVN